MTLQLLATIAAICALPGSGPIFIAKNEMIKCQKELITCVRKQKAVDSPLPDGIALERCVMERSS